MWWTHWWVRQIFTEDAGNLDIPAAVRHSSLMAFVLAAGGALMTIIGVLMILTGDNRAWFLGVFLDIQGVAAFLGAVVMERIELMMFSLLWDKRRHEREELRRLDAADL